MESKCEFIDQYKVARIYISIEACNLYNYACFTSGHDISTEKKLSPKRAFHIVIFGGHFYTPFFNFLFSVE